MIPVSMREAWARSRRLEEEDDLPLQSEEAHDHDMVVRYAVVGMALIFLMAALAIARPITVPLTAGVIFGLVLGPLVDKLIRMGIPQAAAAALVVLSGVFVMAVIVAIFAAPFAIWSDQLPAILSALRTRFSDILAMAKEVEGATKELSGPATGSVVAVDNGSPWLTLAINSSAAAGGMLIFVATIYFYLATRRHMKARALRLCLGAATRRMAGQFLENLESKLASYFAVVSIINLGMGLMAAAIAWLAGLPFPIFWGVLAFILNYIAFVGPVIMAILLLGALLVGDSHGWWAVWPALTYYLVHLVEGNVVTPLMVGRHLSLNPFLVFISFVFWLWLWGPVGAVLSVPLLLVIALSFEATSEFRQKASEDAPLVQENGTAAVEQKAA